MRILVIGGTGFIGRFVVQKLAAEGHDVGVYHRGSSPDAALPAAVTHITGDRRTLATDADRLRAFAPEVVVDLILSSGEQATAVMETFRGIARRAVAASSIDVYRACGVLHGLEEGSLEPLPLTEDSRLRSTLQTCPPEQLRALQDVFGWLDDHYDKIPVERVVLGDSRLPGTILRLPMVHGPGDRLHRLFPLLKRMDDRRRAIVIDERIARWRSPRGYVENVADAIVLATQSEAGAGRVYNVAEPDALSETEWIGGVAEQAGWNGAIIEIPTDRTPPHLRMSGNFDQHWVADSSRIRRELGYRERIPRDEGLRRTIAWERANPPAPYDPVRFDYAAEDAAMRNASVDNIATVDTIVAHERRRTS